MSYRTEIVDALIRISENANAFRHGREDVFEDTNLTEIHCIHWIGTLDQANVTRIANAMGMTRGSISKISKKLLLKRLIETYKSPDNNKNIYFSLTEKGRNMFAAHSEIHNQTISDKMQILNAYKHHEQEIILRFLNDINQHVAEKLRQESPQCVHSNAQ